MSKLTIKLFNKIKIDTGIETTDDTMLSAFALETALYGYTLTSNLLGALKTLGNEAFKSIREDVLNNLSEIKGANKTYTRLFNNFPYSTPDQHEYFEKRVLGQMANDFGVRLGGNVLTALSCGHVIDSLLFDVSEFGACPICQYQVDELSSENNARFDFQSVTPLTPLDLLTDEGLRTEGSKLIARQSSLSVDEKTLLNQLIDQGIQIDLPEKIYRENIPFAFKLFGNEIDTVLSSATDVMRIAYFLSDENSDLSLSQNVKFKLSTSHKRSLLKLLNNRKNLSEDMLRNRERWLRLGERLNPGSKQNRERYPYVAKAFDEIRNAPQNVITFNRQMEDKMRTKTVDKDFVNLMAKRPGEFVRRLDYMMRNGNMDDILAGLETIVSEVPERTLLDLRKYLMSCNDVKHRVFIPKGIVNKMQIVEDNRNPLSLDAITNAVGIIDDDLRKRYSEKEPMGKVFIDPVLKDVLLPFNRRGDSSSSADIISKGSRFPFNGDVIRLFTWWKGNADVDLSIVTYDQNFNNKGYISFQNLNGSGVIHSGDIQSAPKGASEFIDMDINALIGQGIRYVISSIISYTGGSFKDHECFVGFMERDAMTSGEVYEPQSVKIRFDVTSDSRSVSPLLFDLVDRKVIYADITTGGGTFMAVSQQNKKQAALTEALLSLPDRKPTVFDLARLNVEARGELVDNPDDADVIIGFDDAKKIIEEGVV